MKAQSTGRHSIVCSVPTGSCVNFSHPDRCVTRIGSLLGNVPSQNKTSTRIALQLKLLEEERAIQQREYEAERRALEQEKEWLREYNLLVEQLLERRSTIKHNRDVADRAVVAEQSVRPRDSSGYNSSCDDNKPHTNDRVNATDDTTVESSQRLQQKSAIICAEAQPYQSLSPVPADGPANQLHLDGIQQRSDRAFSETISKKQIPIADSIMPTEAKTIQTLPPALSTIAIDENSQTVSVKIKSTSVSQPKCSLSVSGANTIHSDQSVNEALYGNEMQSRAPPIFVGPNVPDPPPPPLRSIAQPPCISLFIAGLTLKCVREFDYLTRLTRVKLKILRDTSSDLLSERNMMMCSSICGERRRPLMNEVRDDGTIGTCMGAAESRHDVMKWLSIISYNLLWALFRSVPSTCSLVISSVPVHKMLNGSVSVRPTEATAKKILLVEMSSFNGRNNHNTLILLAPVIKRMVRISELRRQLAIIAANKHLFG